MLDVHEEASVVAGQDVDLTHAEPRSRTDRTWVPDSRKPDFWPTIRHLREGVERYFGTHVNSPSGSEIYQSALPVVWEMPDRREVPGGWALYMDGHVEWLSYPGEFPMTRAFITRLRRLMPQPIGQAKEPRFAVNHRSPRSYRRRKPAETELSPTEPDSLPGIFPALDYWRPTTVGGIRGYRWNEVLVLPTSEPVDERLRLAVRTDEHKRHLGTGHGYHWFVSNQMDVYSQEALRRDFGLEGGDDRLRPMIAARAMDLMPRLGERAIPYLESVLRDNQKPTTPSEAKSLADAINALASIEGPRAEAAVQSVFAQENENAIAQCLGFREGQRRLVCTGEGFDVGHGYGRVAVNRRPRSFGGHRRRAYRYCASQQGTP